MNNYKVGDTIKIIGNKFGIIYDVKEEKITDTSLVFLGIVQEHTRRKYSLFNIILKEVYDDCMYRDVIGLKKMLLIEKGWF